MGRHCTTFVEYHGRGLLLSELSQESGLSMVVLRDRWNAGDREERLVRPLRTTAPPQATKPLPSEREMTLPSNIAFPLLLQNWMRAVFGVGK